MLAFLLMALCTSTTLVSLAALAVRRRAAAASPAGDRPPVTVLKPLCGADDRLAANLETFFRQDYPDHEIVFGVAGEADPAAAVARALIAAHPEVPARLVVHDGRSGLNPKVANLRGMLAAGGHDLCVISDSNIAVSPGYVASMVAALAPEAGGRVGLVMSLFRGDGERSLGARLEGLHLTSAVAGALAGAELLTGSAFAVGKSLLFRRSVFESLGGMESLASVLAEDYVMGRMFTEAGYQVRIAGEVVRNVTVRQTPWAFVRRLARWGLMRSRLKPLAYPFEPLLVPVAVAALAWALGTSAALAFGWAAALTALRDAASWLLLRGPRGLLRALPLGLAKDLLVVGAWAAAPWKRHVSWRGQRLRVSAGSRLFHQGRGVPSLPAGASPSGPGTRLAAPRASARPSAVAPLSPVPGDIG
jgi:ceramide glucosyltransferase